jgi:hypothetical protein
MECDAENSVKSPVTFWGNFAGHLLYICQTSYTWSSKVPDEFSCLYYNTAQLSKINYTVFVVIYHHYLFLFPCTNTLKLTTLTLIYDVFYKGFTCGTVIY